MTVLYRDAPAFLKVYVEESQSRALRLVLGNDLDAVVTYDRRIVDAPARVGLRTLSPA